MKRFLAVSLLMFIALLLSGTMRVLVVPAKDKVLLRLKLKKGQRYVMRVSTGESYAASSVKQSPKPKGVMTFAMRVIKVMSNGQMKIEMRVAEMHYLDSEMNLDIPATVVSPQMIVRAMKDAPLTMTVTLRGEILSVSGYEGVARRVISLMPAQSRPPASRFKSAVEMSKETFNPQSPDLFNMGQKIYPHTVLASAIRGKA